MTARLGRAPRPCGMRRRLTGLDGGDARNITATVGTREHANGARYLQTHADRVWTDNLLALG